LTLRSISSIIRVRSIPIKKEVERMEKVNMSIWLPRDIHTDLKVLAAMSNKTMQDLIIESVKEFLKKEREIR